MNMLFHRNLLSGLALASGLLLSTSSNAGYIGVGGGFYGGGPGVEVYNWGGPRGGYWYGGGWYGPNVVINVPPPAPRYYVPLCENMEVCDSYGECWIERYCE